MMPLLAAADPQGFTQAMTSSLLAPPTELPSDVRTMQFLAENPEMMSTYRQMQGNNDQLSQIIDLMQIRAMNQEFDTAEDELDRLRTEEDQTARNLLLGGVKVLDSEVKFADVGGSHGPSIAGLTNLNFAGMIEGVSPGTVPGAKARGEAQGELEKNLADFRNIAAPQGSTNFALQQSAEAQATMNQLPAVNVGVVKQRLENVLFSYQALTDEEFTKRFGITRSKIREAIENAENKFAAQNLGITEQPPAVNVGAGQVGRVISDDELRDFE
jgi:hypothetical protein